MSEKRDRLQEYSILSIPYAGDGMLVDIFNLVEDENAGLEFKISTPHCHGFFEMQCILKGECEYLIGNEFAHIDAGQFMITAPGKVHQFSYRSSDMGKYALCFNILERKKLSAEEETIIGLLNSQDYFVGDISITMRELFKMALYERNHPSWSSMRSVRILAGLILVEIARQFNASSAEPPEPADAKRRDHRIIIAERFINDNLDRALRSSDIAASVPISVRQLDRLFLSETGMTVKNYTMVSKALRAKYLLGATELSIQQISESTGFSSPYNFSRFFKEQEGVAPSAYRSNIKKQQENAAYASEPLRPS